jgi:predicted methyltransferase
MGVNRATSTGMEQKGFKMVSESRINQNKRGTWGIR